MMKNPHPSQSRLYMLVAALGLMLLVFVIALYDAQIIHGSENRAKSIVSNATWQSVEASRGILTDRNGKVLVSNRLAYTLTFSKQSFQSDSELNAAIWRLIDLCRQSDVAWVDTLPLSQRAPYLYLASRDEENFTKFLEKNKLNAKSNSSELLRSLRTLFQIDSSYTDQQARLIAGVRYELAGRDSYVFAEDVPTKLISQITDGGFAGVTTGQSSIRAYNTTYAAHLLGRITRIYAEDWEQYREKGYSMDALVGESGVERAFEDWLHGDNGTRLVTTDDKGKITGEVYMQEPKPGGTVALTLDLDLQAAMENSLAKTIESMNDQDSDQRGGAAAVIKVGSGEVLGLASYPTFDLSTFAQNYNELLEDERLPMFNRAVNGTYAPGSTFKMNTAVAALESGIITPSSVIQDKGVYTFYEYPQPWCWVWPLGYTHGRVNVSDAIAVSCNYFFYEVGRLTGIQTIDDYAPQFGLGRSTGIEIGDSVGALASPEYAEAHDLEWTDGQTLTAAIGQSYNLFTPLQLANYIATLVGGGEHYQAHLLKSVKKYDNSKLLYVYDTPPENTVEMSQSTVDAVKEGMHALTTGSPAGAFADCVVSAGAKTGSAQIGTEVANGVFVAFAPYEDPEIAVAIVIEKGGAGAALASTAVEIINAYFSSGLSGDAAGENTLLK